MTEFWLMCKLTEFWLTCKSKVQVVVSLVLKFWPTTWPPIRKRIWVGSYNIEHYPPPSGWIMQDPNKNKMASINPCFTSVSESNLENIPSKKMLYQKLQRRLWNFDWKFSKDGRNLLTFDFLFTMMSKNNNYC